MGPALIALSIHDGYFCFAVADERFVSLIANDIHLSGGKKLTGGVKRVFTKMKHFRLTGWMKVCRI